MVGEFTSWILMLVFIGPSGAGDYTMRLGQYEMMQECFLAWDEHYFDMTDGGEIMPIDWHMLCVPTKEKIQ